jgi:paraquat-inducible protein B
MASAWMVFSMPDDAPDTSPHPTASVVGNSERRRWRMSPIWIIPLVAVLIGVWLAWDTLSKKGPTITISFQSAEGLQAGQSQLKFKDIVLGTVQHLSLTEDRRRVLVRVATTRDALPLLTEGTSFWVVKPRLFAGSVSGLDTLLSGAYIQMRPAEGGSGAAKRDFVGLEDPPVLESEVPGRTFLLKANRLGSISLGSPIFFRDLTVGEVLGWDLADMASSVTIHAFVRAPFDKYVHENSRFWNASGVSVKLGGNGVEVQLESLRAILLGGIAFETPEEKTPSPVSAEDREFPLYANLEAAQGAAYGRKIEFVAYFPGSVRGLAKGADVTLHGLKIGSVQDVSLTYDAAKDAILAPVRFSVEPGRFLGAGKQVKADTATAVDELVARGMRVTLQSANLITGQMLVALEFKPDAPPASVGRDGDAFVVPTIDTGGFAGIEAGAAALLAKVNTIPFDEIGKSLGQTMQGLNQVANGPELKQALVSLSATMLSVQDTVHKLDTGMTPLLKRLPEISADLQKTMAQTNKLASSLESGYGDNTRFNRNLERLLAQANEAMRSIQALSDLLTRHPEALIRGRTNRGTE